MTAAFLLRHRKTMIATQQRDTIQPDPAESFERYSIRAHKLLAGKIADPMQRNEAIRRYWQKFRGPTTAEKLARQRFAPDKYDTVTDVCVFAEHETKDAEGETRRYGLAELAKIVRNCNERIVDVDAFPAISDGHTSDGEGADPAVLGYAGNFRLGMIGRKTPRWAILCDEYRLREAKPVLNAKPRRSVELWTYKDTGRAHFDPIAALGAEAPRLPLPVRFSTVRRGDATLERYSAAAAPGAMTSFAGAHPGNGNTFVKQPVSGGGRRKKKPAKYQQENCAMALSPEDKAELVEAISSLPQFQFLDQLMNSDAGRKMVEPGLDDADAAAAQKMAADEDEDDLDPMAGLDDDQPGMGDGDADDTGGLPMGGEGPGMAEGDDDLADLGDVLGDEDEEENPKKFMQPYSKRAAKGANVQRQRYHAIAQQNQQLVKQNRELAKNHKTLIQRYGMLEQTVAVIQRESTDAKRAAVIDGLAQKYPQFIDADEEKQATLYSLEANMSDADFDKHVAQLERYAQRSSPVTHMIPQGELRRPTTDRERYAAQESELAVKIATEAVDAGKPITFEAAKEQARQRLAASR